MSSQTDKPGCGWSGKLPDFQQTAACESCHKLRSAGDVTRCRLRGGPRIEGLGDVVAKVTHATGIAQAVEFITGGDCGCMQRQMKLNKALPIGGDDPPTDPAEAQ